ncbi:MAG: PilZ domain-containing protein [Nitrospirota bacterium]
MTRKDNRRNRRYSVEGLQGNLMCTSDLEILNISLEGAAIETTRRLDLNREYSFKIGHKNAVVNLRGRVVWAVLVSREAGPGRFRPIYRAGIQFTGALSDRARMLLRFIEENRIKTIESRLGGLRFRISNQEDVKADFPKRYKVQKISLSGMLMETDYPLDIDGHYDIEMFLDEAVINILVRIASCSKRDAENMTAYDIGIEFINMSGEDEKILRQFVGGLEG